MAKRYDRNTAILFKLEVNEGEDSAPVPANDAVLVRKFQFKRDLKYVNVPEVRPYFGKGIDLVGASFISGSFELSLAGSGAAGTAPPWARFLRCAAFGEVLSVGASADYTPVSSALESGTMYIYDAGVLTKALATKINITSFKMGYGDVPIIGCNFIALDGGDTAVVTPAVTLTPWKAPVAINTANSGLLTIGCTYAAGALVGGTTYPSKGLELAMGGQLSFTELLGGESVDLTDRDVTGKITLDLTAAQEVSNTDIVKAGTTTGIGILHGTVAGYKILTHLPNSQLKNPTKDTLNGKRVITYDINAVPTQGTGNDEWRIVAL